MTALTTIVALLALVTPAFPQYLAGHWQSGVVEEAGLSSDLDRSVLGPGAHATRVVDLVVLESGRGTLTITRKVLNGRKQIVAGTPSVDRVEFNIGPVVRSPEMGPLPHYSTAIARAAESYPDLRQEPVALAGIAVQIIADDSDHSRVEIRFDTPEATGSFSETLHRVTTAHAGKAAD